jgi:hypothetical protein
MSPIEFRENEDEPSGVHTVLVYVCACGGDSSVQIRDGWSNGVGPQTLEGFMQ